MNIFYPEYYKTFRCIASDCPDSCCHEWEVDVEPEAAAFYRSLPGALGDRLRQVLRDTEDGACMTLENGRCPMWRADGLCRIQAMLGHEALCYTCRTYPRLRHEYGTFTELGLELSCPEAARLIITGKGRTVCCESSPDAELPDYDEKVMSTLLASRETLRGLLAKASLSPAQLLTVLLFYAYDVQEEIDGGEPAVLDVDAILKQAASLPERVDIPQFLGFFKDLEILTSRWKARLDAPCPGPWANAYRYLIRYFLDRYWLQAVSDLDLVCRAKLIVTSCLLIRILGGDLIETAQLFSKEIENDPDNVEALLDGAHAAPALTDLHLLSLLREN